MSDVLVLSPAYEPLACVGWQRAVTLWYGERAEVVAEYPDRVIRSVSQAMPMPAVVRFKIGRRRIRLASRFNRSNVYLRDGGCCQYCAVPVPLKRATWDHVVPRSRGGETEWTNVVVACKRCNQRKSDRTPQEAGMPLVRRPREPHGIPDALDVHAVLKHGIPEAWRPFLGEMQRWATALAA